ncbi:MAG TPA: transcription elongation factor GreA [Fimbriimonadaceae bacterium]|nr:transcription elongation factor GreA [Fimbriimonadaceae bacterium]
MSSDVLLTKEGFEKLKAELEHLKSVERQKIADNIREAKSHGDLRENAMYHEAKLNQKRLEGRIADLEKVVQIAQIVERPDHSGDIAHLGSTVTLRDLKWNDEVKLRLVGAFEADPTQDMISITSPLGSALIGKQIDDEIEYEAPAGIQKYKILRIDG